VINACFDIARRLKRRPIEVELMELHAPAISDSAGAIAERDLVEGILQSLDERGRAIVVLHYYLGMPLTEVAAFLDIPVGTVKSRLHRALDEMRLVMTVDAVRGPANAGGQHA
jgi:RNA polymerase sigma-70 factor (ECF subfamily)